MLAWGRIGLNSADQAGYPSYNVFSVRDPYHSDRVLAAEHRSSAQPSMLPVRLRGFSVEARRVIPLTTGCHSCWALNQRLILCCA